MDLQSLANLGELIGAIAVVVSLVYLALQVRQNTRSQQMENYARALDRVSSIQAQLSKDSQFSSIFSSAVIGASTVTPHQRIQFTWSLYETFGALEFMFFAARDGAIPDEVWERWSSVLAWWLSFPGVRQWWHARPVPFTESFTAYVEHIIEKRPSDRDAAKRWSDFVAGTGSDSNEITKRAK